MHHDRDCRVWLCQAPLPRDMTQEALAEDVGCATQTMRSSENGRRRPSREMAARLAEILHLPPTACDDFVSNVRAPLVARHLDQISRSLTRGRN